MTDETSPQTVKWTADELFAALNGLKLRAAVNQRDAENQATFEITAETLPIHAIIKTLQYGHQRIHTDSFGSGDYEPKTRADLVSQHVASYVDGSYLDSARTRKATVPTEVNIRRKVTIAALDKSDRQKLAKMTDDERAKSLDETWAKNEAKLRPVFDAEIEEMKRRAEKPKVAGIKL